MTMSNFLFLSGSNTNLRKWVNTVIVADGNSNTINTGAGTDGGFPYTYFLMEQLATRLDITTVTMYNIAVGGQTTVNMLADFDTQIPPLIDPQKRSLYLMWEIANDLYFSGDTSAVYDRTLLCCQKALNLDMYVIVMTCPHRGFTGNTSAGDTVNVYNSKLDIINNNILLNKNLFGGNVADLAGDYRLSTPQNTIYYRPDGIHYTEQGRRAIADVVLKAMQKLKL